MRSLFLIGKLSGVQTAATNGTAESREKFLIGEPI
jgi:hypothetical protein